jgi:hypothetical protein
MYRSMYTLRAFATALLAVVFLAVPTSAVPAPASGHRVPDIWWKTDKIAVNKGKKALRASLEI